MARSRCRSRATQDVSAVPDDTSSMDEIAEAYSLVEERAGDRIHHRECEGDPLRHPVESAQCPTKKLRVRGDARCRTTSLDRHQPRKFRRSTGFKRKADGKLASAEPEMKTHGSGAHFHNLRVHSTFSGRKLHTDEREKRIGEDIWILSARRAAGPQSSASRTGVRITVRSRGIGESVPCGNETPRATVVDPQPFFSLRGKRRGQRNLGNLLRLELLAGVGQGLLAVLPWAEAKTGCYNRQGTRWLSSRLDHFCGEI